MFIIDQALFIYTFEPFYPFWYIYDIFKYMIF